MTSNKTCTIALESIIYYYNKETSQLSGMCKSCGSEIVAVAILVTHVLSGVTTQLPKILAVNHLVTPSSGAFRHEIVAPRNPSCPHRNPLVLGALMVLSTSCQRIEIDGSWFELLDTIDPIDTL